MQISIIVPVYNAEKYLAECIDSILAQTFTDFELLLIDDGSCDSSGKKTNGLRLFTQKMGVRPLRVIWVWKWQKGSIFALLIVMIRYTIGI